MKKYWPYIATFLAGAIAGLIAMFKLMGERIEINVKKQRIRGRDNKMILDIDPVVDKPKKRPKRTREERKSERKERKSK